MSDEADLRDLDSQRVAEHVLSDDMFEPLRSETVPYWQDEDAAEPDAPPDWLDLELLQAIAEILKWGGLVLVAALTLYAAWRIANHLRGPLRVARRPPADTAEASTGALIAKVADPADVIGACRGLWASGSREKRRAAVALLYRASVAAAARAGGFEVPDSATEREVLRLARQLPVADALREITRAWTAFAYADIEPAEETFDGLLGRWSEAFAGGAHAERHA